MRFAEGQLIKGPRSEGNPIVPPHSVYFYKYRGTILSIKVADGVYVDEEELKRQMVYEMFPND